MSDPWAERHPRAGGLRGEDREQVLSFAEGYNACLAAVRPEHDRVVAERDEETTKRHALEATSLRTIDDLARRLAEAEADADRLASDARNLAAALERARKAAAWSSHAEVLVGHRWAIEQHDALLAQREGGQ